MCQAPRDTCGLIEATSTGPRHQEAFLGRLREDEVSEVRGKEERREGRGKVGKEKGRKAGKDKGRGRKGERRKARQRMRARRERRKGKRGGGRKRLDL